MLLTWTGVRFQCTASGPEERKKLSLAGFHFDWQKKSYWTGRVDVAREFEPYADSRAKERFHKEETQVQLSRAVDPKDVNIDEYQIPVPEGKSYLPFQRIGILVALSRFGFDISRLKKKP